MNETSGSAQIQQLLELLAVVSSYSTQDRAIHGAVERAAQALEAEVAAVIVDGALVAAVGFPAGAVPEAELLAVARLERSEVDVPGVGACHAMSAGWGGPHPGQLVLARWGDSFTVEERGVVRGMARLLELTLTMLRTLQAEHALRERAEQLFDIQRAISRRQPLEAILRRITSAAQELLAAETVGLWLRDTADPNEITLVAGSGPGTDHLHAAARAAMSTEEVLLRPDLMAAPVYDSGTVAGSLLVSAPRPDAQTLLTFAEHVTIALTDANTVDRMHQAFHDSLTGLASRGLFLDRLGEQLDGPDPTALLYLDLDGFKAINDTLGHAVGDTLLATTAQRLQSQLRGDDLAARIGGDEFAILLHRVGAPDDAVRVAERILRALDQPLVVAGQRLQINASIGIVLSPPGPPDPTELLRRADLAMYQAKRTGRGGYALFNEHIVHSQSK